MEQKKLTFIESVMLVAGAGIGTGILTIPYAISKIGLWGTIVALIAALFFSAFMYWFIAELTLRSKSSTGLLGILEEHLFIGRKKKLLSGIFFVILVILLLENLVVYILCAGNVITDLLGIPSVAAKVIFYLLASVVILFGIKGIGIGEKYSVFLIGAVILALTILSVLWPKQEIAFTFGEPSVVFAVYGLFMFAFSAIFSIIQVCNNIDKKNMAKPAVLCGLGVNALLTFAFGYAAVLGSEQVTEVATIGLCETLGLPFVRVICAVFVILAMFSSYWSSGLAFAEVIEEQFHMGRRKAWFLSTAPTILIAILLPLTVLDYVQIGAGALSVILVLVVLPAYNNAMKKKANKFLLILVGIGILLMAVSSFISIP